MTSKSDIRIGISGWRYKGWRGTFYPDDLVQAKELGFASRHFNSIELNGSFYSLQRPDSFQRWYEETPDDFVFAIKGSRYVTHMRRLKEIETPLATSLPRDFSGWATNWAPFFGSSRQTLHLIKNDSKISSPFCPRVNLKLPISRRSVMIG